MSSQSDVSVRNFIIWGAKGLAVGVIAAAVLLFALTAAAYKMTDPDLVVELMGYGTLLISAVIAGVTAGRVSGISGGGAAIAGGTAGAMLLSLILLMSLIPAEAPREPLSSAVTVLMYVAVPALAVIGGFALRKKQSRRPRHKRRR